MFVNNYIVMGNKIIHSEIQKLNLEDLKELLKNLKLFKDLIKKLWVRWKELFKRWLTWKKELIVEYFSSISEELAFEKAKVVYGKVFSSNNTFRWVSKKEIKFISKKELWGGIKVYFDDSMVDLSFSKIEKFIKG